MDNEQATPEGAKFRHFANVSPYHQQLGFDNYHQQLGGLRAESDLRKYLKTHSGEKWNKECHFETSFANLYDQKLGFDNDEDL